MLSIYTHIPFCLQKCHYCSFNSYSFSALNVEPQDIEQKYVAAVIEEFNKQIEYLNLHRKIYSETVTTLYFGGGTPSVFSAESIEKIISAMKGRIVFAPDIEITIEANPATLSREKLLLLKESGINRISLGVQSFFDSKLKFLGRVHSTADVAAALENIRNAGFENISLDLIFGSEQDSPESLREELRQVALIAPDHVSIYGLSIEEGSKFYALSGGCKKGRADLAPTFVCNDDSYAEMYHLIQHELGGMGYKQYEISNFAKPGFESRHNINYWNGGNYLGIGSGASSYFADDTTARRWTNIRHPLEYIGAVCFSTAEDFPKEYMEDLSLRERKTEFIFLSLRQSVGMDLKHYRELFQEDFLTAYRAEINQLLNKGMLTIENNFCKIPPEKFIFADGIIEGLL